jgi:hypothetical protein
MLRVCSADGCTILTLGELCAVHEPKPERTDWPRGRPFPELRGQAGKLHVAHVEAERLGHPDSVLELSP